MFKKFSIIIIFKNSDKTLNRCLDSIVSQKYKNIEVIMVDSDSTDNSLQIINNYKNFIPIRYFNCPFGGVGEARNMGVSNVTGDYILFLECVYKFFIIGCYYAISNPLRMR